MTTAQPPPLTVGEVYRLGGWDVRYARVYALASSGSVACSITDGNGDQRELAIEYWRYEADGWTDASGGLAKLTVSGGFQPDGVIHWSDDHDEFSAIYRYDDRTEAPGWGRTQVGQMRIESQPIPRPLPAIVASLRDRARAVALEAGEPGLEGDIDLVLLLLDSDEESIALRTLCDALDRSGMTLHRSEFVELAREAERLGLLDEEWTAVERLVQD